MKSFALWRLSTSFSPVPETIYWKIAEDLYAALPSSCHRQLTTWIQPHQMSHPVQQDESIDHIRAVSDCYKSLYTFSACTYLATDWWKAMWTNNTGAERMQAWQLLMNNTPPYWNFECSNQIKIYMAEALTERLCEWFLLLSKFSFLVLRLPFNIFF